MRLAQLIQLQIIYCTAAVLYNGASLYLTATGRPPLTATSPWLGLLVMVVYGLFLLTGNPQTLGLYRILMALAVIVLGYGGVISHLIQYSTNPGLYSSFVAWLLAVSINTFGLVLNIIAATGHIKTS